ncbi:hypothetical protein Hanom_Chr12g01133611 [Helianthus anomalus]
MHEKKLRYWFVKDGKRKRTPKASPTVTAPKVSTPKIVVKGPSKKSPPRLIDEIVIPPTEITQEGVDLAKVTFEQYVKHTEDTAKAQSSSVEKVAESSAKHTVSVKEREPEGIAHTHSSDADDESSETESDIDKSKVGVGKVTLKKKPLKKKKKGSDEEDETYIPTPQAEKKKLLKKRKAVQSGVIPQSVRARKGSVSVHEKQSEKKDDAETPKPKKTSLPGLFEGSPNVQGEFTDDILPYEEYDMFHDATVKELTKKVSLLEKEKAKAEVERDELKKKLEKLIKVNEEMTSVVKNHAKRINTLVEDVDDNAKIFEKLSTELFEVNVKYANMNETNQTLHQMLDELHEASANEIKVLKLEIEALRADKAVKDEQLKMLYTIMEHHLGINVQAIYNDLEIQRVEERRSQREKELAEAATQKKK